MECFLAQRKKKNKLFMSRIIYNSKMEANL